MHTAGSAAVRQALRRKSCVIGVIVLLFSGVVQVQTGETDEGKNLQVDYCSWKTNIFFYLVKNGLV
jgi:hypothetical protein